jgi:hypothetical protein
VLRWLAAKRCPINAQTCLSALGNLPGKSVCRAWLQPKHKSQQQRKKNKW